MSISLLGEKVILQRQIKMEGHGNGVPYSKTGDKDQDEVMRWHDLGRRCGGQNLRSHRLI
jgi:hypothetical protein